MGDDRADTRRRSRAGIHRRPGNEFGVTKQGRHEVTPRHAARFPRRRNQPSKIVITPRRRYPPALSRSERPEDERYAAQHQQHDRDHHGDRCLDALRRDDRGTDRARIGGAPTTQRHRSRGVGASNGATTARHAAPSTSARSVSQLLHCNHANSVTSSVSSDKADANMPSRTIQQFSPLLETVTAGIALPRAMPCRV